MTDLNMYITFDCAGIVAFWKHWWKTDVKTHWTVSLCCSCSHFNFSNTHIVIPTSGLKVIPWVLFSRSFLRRSLVQKLWCEVIFGFGFCCATQIIQKVKADRGCARSRLCSSKEDGRYYNQFFTLQHCTVWYIKKGGNAPRGLRIKRARDDYASYLILRKPHYCWGTKTTAVLISPVLLIDWVVLLIV